LIATELVEVEALTDCHRTCCACWRRRHYLRKIALWQQLGYQVKLWFLSLPSDDIAISRVAERVAQGGHNIPEQVIRRRFKSGIENFHERYSKVVDSWALYDNYLRPPKLIDWSNK
jgi:predicted ABC-type ATPase